MIRIGSKRCEYNCCVYVLSHDNGPSIFLLLYVVDMLNSAKRMSEVNKLKILLSREFDIKDLGAIKKIIGIEIRRDRALERLWLSQSGYVGKVLERFSMENAKPISTHLANHFRLLIRVQVGILESTIFINLNSSYCRSKATVVWGL